MAKMLLLSLLLVSLPFSTGGAFAPPNSAFTPSLEFPSFVDDFYTAANFKWLQSAEPPSSSFLEVETRTARLLRRLVRETAHKVRRRSSTTGGAAAATSAELSRAEVLVGNWFLSGIDIRARKSQGLRPLDHIFAALRTISDKGALAGMLARKGLDLFFSIAPEVDLGSDGLPYVRLYLSPSNDIFLPGSEMDLLLKPCVMTAATNSSELQAELQACSNALAIVARTFEKLGDSPEAAQANAQHVIASVVALLPDDVPADTISLSVLDIVEGVPEFNFTAYFSALGVNPEMVFVVSSGWFPAFGKWIRAVSPEQLEAFLRWRVISIMGPFLDDEISDILLVAEESMTSSEKVFKFLNEDPVVGTVLAQLFTRQILPPKNYDLVKRFTEALHASLRHHIQVLPWMQEATRMEALKKVDTLSIFIGAPQMELFMDMVATPDSYIGNALLAKEVKRVSDLAYIDTPEIARKATAWRGGMPQTANAFYQPTRNSVYINVGILQPPFFQAQAADEINFGAIGTIIGHEMTHGFDELGRTYDFQGIRRNWWTENDNKDFVRISSALVSLFDNYTYFNSPVNGSLTLGENIADLGGMAIAYDAWNASRLTGGLPLAENSTRKRVQRSWTVYTQPQRFFLSNAKIWKAVDTAEGAALRLREDVHAPPIFRNNGPVSNLDAFYLAFDVRKGDGMYREPSKRVTIW